MATLSDNVSNSNTTGFKSGSAVFSDMLTSGSGAVGTLEGVSGGDGAYVDSIVSNLTQGALEPTGKPYDLAVDGDGFFTLAKPDANGNATTEISYTRAGNFQLDSKGRLVNSDGYLVMSIPIGGNGENLIPITLTGRDALPVATTTAKVVGNLNASTSSIIGALPETFQTSAEIATYSPFNTAVRVIDSLGTPHDIGLSFFKTGINPEGGATWQVRAFVNNSEVGDTTGVPVQIGKIEELTIDANGAVAGNPNFTVEAKWAGGAAASTVNIDLSAFTGYSKESFVSATTSNGSVPGTAKSIAFGTNGDVSVVLDSGDRTQIGTLALARFPNELGLRRAGNTLFAPSTAAGEVSYDAPTVKGRGGLAQGTIESSNVDLADQFVNVIRVQRTYQAGSQVIKTADELLNSTIQIA
jgi:flagellar hook protein FlgE